MPESNTLTNLRKWFRGCPAISRQRRLNVDFLPETATEYALYAEPVQIAYRENVLGERIPQDIQTLRYIFMSRESFGADVTQNMENQEFYQDVLSWILEQNQAGNFPRISEGTVRSIVPTLTPFMVAADAGTARYQITIEITYKRY